MTATQPEIPPAIEPSYDPAPDTGPGITPDDPGVIETPPLPGEPAPDAPPAETPAPDGPYIPGENQPEARRTFVKPAHWSNEPVPEPSAPTDAPDPDGLSPTRYGDWTKNGIAIDF